MQIVIDIDKQDYEDIRFEKCVPDYMQVEIGKAIMRGKVLPEQKRPRQKIDRDKVIQFYKNGILGPEMSCITGYPLSAIYRVLREEGLVKRRRKPDANSN